MSDTSIQQKKYLDEQILYYRARAGEYDDWYLRKGRYNYGEKWNTLWFKEVSQLKEELKRFSPKGRVLEIAAGTGWWTKEFVRYTGSLTALDASSEVLLINREKLGSSHITYIQEDVMKWKPNKVYDVVFFSFWISHIPPKLFKKFWNVVRMSLKSNGRVFFIDNYQSERNVISGKSFRKTKSIINQRKLEDGREFNVIKIFYNPKALERKMSKLGWEISVATTSNYFFYGCGKMK